MATVVLFTRAYKKRISHYYLQRPRPHTVMGEDCTWYSAPPIYSLYRITRANRIPPTSDKGLNWPNPMQLHLTSASPVSFYSDRPSIQIPQRYEAVTVLLECLNDCLQEPYHPLVAIERYGHSRCLMIR